MREYDTSDGDEDDDSHDNVADIYEPLENATRQLQETMSAIMNAKIQYTEHNHQGNTKARKEIASLKRSLSMKETEFEEAAKRAKKEKQGLEKKLTKLEQSLRTAKDEVSLLKETHTQLEKKGKERAAKVESMKGMLDSFSDT